MLCSCVGDAVGDEDIVGDGGQRLLLQHGHVFVCCGMEDDARLMDGKEVLQQSGIACICEEELCFGVCCVCSKLLLQMVEVTFAGIEQKQTGCTQLCQMQSERGSNGSACTRDQDRHFDDGPGSFWPRREDGSGKKVVPVDAMQRRKHKCSIN